MKSLRPLCFDTSFSSNYLLPFKREYLTVEIEKHRKQNHCNSQNEGGSLAECVSDRHQPTDNFTSPCVVCALRACVCVSVLGSNHQFQQHPYLHHIYQPEQPFLLRGQAKRGWLGGLAVIEVQEKHNLSNIWALSADLDRKAAKCFTVWPE